MKLIRVILKVCSQKAKLMVLMNLSTLPMHSST